MVEEKQGESPDAYKARLLEQQKQLLSEGLQECRSHYR